MGSVHSVPGALLRKYPHANIVNEIDVCKAVNSSYTKFIAIFKYICKLYVIINHIHACVKGNGTGIRAELCDSKAMNKILTVVLPRLTVSVSEGDPFSNTHIVTIRTGGPRPPIE